MISKSLNLMRIMKLAYSGMGKDKLLVFLMRQLNNKLLKPQRIVQPSCYVSDLPKITFLDSASSCCYSNKDSMPRTVIRRKSVLK